MKIIYRSCDKHKFLSFWDIYCPFSPVATQKIKILKLKKTPGNIIILHFGTINENHMNHMMYSSCNIEHDGQNFLLFWTVFCCFILITTQKIKTLKNWKKFTHVSHKRQSHFVWFLSYQAQRIDFFVILDYFFSFTPLTTQNFFEEIKKNTQSIIILGMCTIKEII